MFGDIVSDLCAGLVGGLGFAPSANMGDKYAVFEPTHGSAPKYAGQYKVNPMAMLLTARMMFDWLGHSRGNEGAVRMAASMSRATTAALADREARTGDINGRGNTASFTQAVIHNLTR